MGDFKLLAIRPLEGCDSKFLKVLKPNRVYKFYNDYDFIHIDKDENNDVECITSKLSIPGNLYSLKKPNGDNLPINISAIVGKNGSGKSTLLELFFVAVYNLALKEGILTNIENAKGEEVSLEKIKGIKVEIYYLLDENIYCLKINGESEISFEYIKFTHKEPDIASINQVTKREFFINKILDNKEGLLKDFFFYSIAVNYSFYGLNSDLSGNWIQALFHKNDGYQTPLVISPYRDEGNIDINTEIYLAKQRYLTNILRPVVHTNNFRGNLSIFLQPTDITFIINRSKIKYAYRTGMKEEDIVSFEKFFKINDKELLFHEIYVVFFDSKEPSNDIKYKDEVEKYIIKKLIQIARTYHKYYGFFTNKLIIHVLCIYQNLKLKGIKSSTIIRMMNLK